MLKQHANLLIKLFLIILLCLLILFILNSNETETVGPYTAEAIKPELGLVDHTPTSTPKPTAVPTPLATAEPENNYLDKIKKWEKEHYYATKVWERFRREGFSQEITCAIIGNMMIETSGGTLDLRPDIYSPDGEYYGLCQWSRYYYPEVFGSSFEQQLDFLLKTISLEIDVFGKNYREGFIYEDFLTMTDTAEAALVFAKAYERCRPTSYELRKEAAVKAYEYFNLE